MNTRSFYAVQQVCDGIAPIDYFFAQAVFKSHQVEPRLSVEGLAADRQQNLNVLMSLMALSYAQRHGHSCLPLAAIANQVWWRSSELGRQGYEFASAEEIKRGIANLTVNLPQPACVRLENDCLYTERYWQFEQSTQLALHRLHRVIPINEDAKDRLLAIWPLLFPNKASPGKEKVDWQQVAVMLASYHGLTLLSGGPGTGKTHTVARILLALKITAEKPLKIVLAAPTGKAAQRLSESLKNNFSALSEIPELKTAVDGIPLQAQTIHRLLGLREQNVDAKHNAQNRLTLDVLVVDESSMIDLALMTRVLRALPDHCRLILVGDAQQLPSVESGNVLPRLMPDIANQFSYLQRQWLEDFGIHYCSNDNDLNDSATSDSNNPCILLAQSFRFGQKVAQLAQAINQGEGDPAWHTLMSLDQDGESGIEVIQTNDFNTETISMISAEYSKVCNAGSLSDAFMQAQKFRVLAAMKQGDYGTESLNHTIENRLIARLGLLAGTDNFKGQLLMVSRNIHALGLYNGDVGIVWPDQSGKLLLFFEGDANAQFRSFDLNRVPATQSVYAMTIHKSQGSEFNHAMVILPPQGGQNILSKELLYTAVTRSQSRLTVVCNQAIFTHAVNHQTQRFSGLKPLT